MAKSRYLYLVPVTGKYVRVSLGDKVVEIWRVHPGHPDVNGTAILYDDAVRVLALQPSVATLVPKIEGGKFVPQLEGDDAELVRQAQLSGTSMFPGMRPVEAPASETSKKSEATAEILKQLSDATAALKKEAERNDALEARLKALESAAAKPAKETTSAK